MGIQAILPISVDFCNKKYILVNAKQYDRDSRFLLVSCYNGGTYFPLSKGLHGAYIRYKKADGLSVLNSCDIKDGKVLVELTEKMLSVQGTCVADLVIVSGSVANVNSSGQITGFSGGSIISTMIFHINVTENPVENWQIKEDYKDEFDELNDLFTRAEAHYENVVTAALSWTEGGTGTRQGENTDNAKYYSEQARGFHDNSESIRDNMLRIKSETINEMDRITEENIILRDDSLRIKSETQAIEVNVLKHSAETANKASIAQSSAANASNSASAAANSASAAKTSETNAKTSETKAKTSETKSLTSEQNAKASETNAKTSETKAKTSETNAKTSETNALKSEQNAKASEVASSTSEKNAKTYMDNAKSSENNAKASETNSKSYMDNAKVSEDNAKASESNASNSEANAQTYMNETKTSENNAFNYANKAQSYAVGGTGTRENEDTDNAYWYYELIKNIVIGLDSGFIPMGTISFSELATVEKATGYVYNMREDFMTDESFAEGSGKSYTAGVNVYCRSDGLWDCLGGTITPTATVSEVKDYLGI